MLRPIPIAFPDAIRQGQLLIAPVRLEIAHPEIASRLQSRGWIRWSCT